MIIKSDEQNKSKKLKDTRSHLLIRIHAAQRLFMWHFLQERLELVLVSEHPKSGGTWFSQMLAEALEIPFPRNKRPRFESCLMHGHLMYHPNFKKIVGVVRDGRDIMVSAYYHSLFSNDRNSDTRVDYYRKKLMFDDFDNIKANLPEFIRFMFQDYAKGYTHFNWSDFVNGYIDNENAFIVKYEDLLIDAVPSLTGAIKFLGKEAVSDQRLKEVEKLFSFRRLSKRKPGQENTNSFLRKGIAGDWKNHFSQEACEAFHEFGGEELIALGYEKDDLWF